MNKRLISKISVLIIAILSAFAFLFAVETASKISSHPLISVIMRIVFFIMMVILFILKKKEYFVYLFILLYPFYRIAFSGLSLFSIMTAILVCLYFKEIIDYLKKVKNPFRNQIFIIFACIIFTTCIAYSKSSAIEKALFYLNLYIVYIILSALFYNGIEIKKIFILLLVVAIFAVFVSFFQAIMGVEAIKLFFGEYNPNIGLKGTYQRVPSIFNEAQFAGVFFSMMSFISLGMMAYYPKKRWFLKMICVLFIFGLLLSGTRISIIALLLGFIFIQCLSFSFKRYVISIFIVLMLITIFGLSYERILPSSVRSRVEAISLRESFKYRYMIWERSMPIIINNPFGVGLGGENLYVAAKKSGAYVFPELDTYPRYRTFTHFENSYFTVLYSLGILGFIAFIMLIFKAIFIAVLNIFKSKNSPERIFMTYAVSSLLVWVIAVGTSPQINHIQPMFMFILIIAALNYLSSTCSLKITSKK